MKKNYPTKMLTALGDANAGVYNVDVSEENLTLIEQWQDHQQAVMGGRKITRREILSYQLRHGQKQLEKDIKEFRKHLEKIENL